MARRYIDADVLMAVIHRFCCKHCPIDRCRGCKVNNILGYIKSLCTIEKAETIIHAHWEYTGESGGKKIYRCTNCQMLLPGTGNFCKECGAQMDEKEGATNV